MQTGVTIVNWRQWLWNLTNFFVISFCLPFWPWPCTNNRIWNVLEQLTNRNVFVNIFNCGVNVKTKDCAGLRPFQHKLQHHRFHGRVSWPVPQLPFCFVLGDTIVINQIIDHALRHFSETWTWQNCSLTRRHSGKQSSLWGRKNVWGAKRASEREASKIANF